MHFWRLIESLLRDLRLSDKEFFDKTGLKSANFARWKENEGVIPQMGTIRKIEDGLGVEFRFDSNNRPVRWERKTTKSSQSTIENSAIHPNNGGVEENGDKYFPLRERIEFPASAREMVESIKFYGGTIDWGSFTQEQQEKLQWKYEQTKIAVDKAYREYERVLEEKESEFSLYMIRIKLGEDLAAGDEPF